MSKLIPLEDKLKRIVVRKKVERKTVKKNSLPSDLRTIPKKQRKKKKRKEYGNKGMIHGINHYSLDPEKVKRQRILTKIGCMKKDVFFMVDGLTIQEKIINPINTNSGVLFEDDLKYLQ